MRAPIYRRDGGPRSGLAASNDTAPGVEAGAEPTPTTEQLLNSSEFHRRLADARAKREEALRQRHLETDPTEKPRQPVVPPIANFAALMQAKPFEPSEEMVEEQPPTESVDTACDTSVADIPKVAPPARIELSAEEAARRKLGAAMALSRLPERPLEPALVPLVSASTLAGFANRPAVPGAAALGAFALIAWFLVSGGEPPSPSPETVPASIAELDEDRTNKTVEVAALPPTEVEVLPLQSSAPTLEFGAEQDDSPVVAPSVVAAELVIKEVVPVTIQTVLPKLDVIAPVATVEEAPTVETAAVGVRRPISRPVENAGLEADTAGLASAIDLLVQEALAGEEAAEAPVVPASFIPAAAQLSPTQSGASPARPLVIHVPDGLEDGGAEVPVDKINELVTPYVTSKQVPFEVTETHVRVYHEPDFAAAQDVAARLDVGVRYMTAFEPRPAVGLIELWWKGQAAPKRIPIEAAPVRITASSQTAADFASEVREPSILKENPSANKAWVPAPRFGSSSQVAEQESVARNDASDTVSQLPDANAADAAPTGLRALFKRLGASDIDENTEFLRPPGQ